MEKLLSVMAALRNPDGGCPWDLEQTFETIAPYTIEEAYEVEEAILNKDYVSLKEELGDLLLQVVYHSQLASEEDIFSFQDVADVVSQKMIDRHPHVFGSSEERDAASQIVAWEKQKAEERARKAKLSGNDSISRLDGVAINLPALMRAGKLSKRAARAGFDWPGVDGVFVKIDEEVAEIKEVLPSSSCDTSKELEEEVGDLLFTVVNLARKLSVDPEVALRSANRKFEARFRHLESSIDDVEKATPGELEQAWDRAKTDLKV
jgi:ATP diphosphatase